MIKKTEAFIGMIFILFIALFLITGCGKKEENQEVQKPSANEPAAVDTAKKMTAVPKDTIPDITGNWAGTFDQRSATMSVIKQTGTGFSAIMKIDTKTNSIKMEDLGSSRFSGKYEAQLSDDGKQIKGTFIMRADGKSYGFNFKMK